jgi:beta-lactamase regulating signal transducer with metallopeptidase domain/ankyrin repeat protein
MIARFLHNLESVFAWILEASWQASVLVVLVLLLQVVLRGRLNPRWYHALWLLVVLRLVLPVLPESALSLFQFTPHAPPVITQSVTEPIFISAPAQTTPQPLLETPAPAYPFSIYTILALFWLTGAFGLLIVTWRVNYRFARHLRNATAIDDPHLLEIAADAQAKLGVHRHLRLIESAQAKSPAIMGLFHSTLILPEGVRAKFTDDELRFIFLHEFAHLKRGDLAVQWLIALLQILHWFNPVLWYAFRRIRADREPATDALVLSRTGEAQKESYGQVLIKLLENYHQRHSLPTLVGILEDKDQFKRRFSLIAKFTRGAYGWSLLGVLLLGAVAMVGLTKNKTSAPRAATSAFHVELQVSGQPITLPEASQQATTDLLKELLVLRYVNGTPEEIFHWQQLPNTSVEHIKASGSFLHVVFIKEPSIQVGTHYSLYPEEVWIGLQDSPAGDCYPGYPGGVEVVTDGKDGTYNLFFGSKSLLAGIGLDPGIYPHLSDSMRKSLDSARANYQTYLAWSARKDASGQPVNQQAIVAAQAGDVTALQKLVSEGVDLKAIKGRAPTLLFEATSPEMAELLIKQGIDVNARDSAGGTALNRICQNPSPKTSAIVKVLLVHGADPNSREGQLGETPLMAARDAATVDLLIAHGADLKATLTDGTKLISFVGTKPPEYLAALLRHGIPFDPKTDGPTVLVSACWINNLPLIKDLLARGVDPNLSGVWSMKNGKPDLMKPLQAVVVAGHLDSAKLLIEHGAKGDDDMLTALVNRRKKIVQFLWEHGVHNISELAYAISQDAPVGDLQKILDRGISVDPPQDKKFGPLAIAAQLGNMDAVKFLIQRGAAVNKGPVFNPAFPIYQMSPLVMAASEGQDEIIAYLLTQGANPDPNALWDAAENSTPYEDQRSQDHFEKTVRILLDAGALKSATPEEQGYILSSALGTRQGPPNATVVKMLLDAGINPEAPMPYLVDNGEKPNSVIGYFRDRYQKYKDEPDYASLMTPLKPLIDLLEAADKKGATKSDTGTQSLDPNVHLRAAVWQGDAATVRKLLGQGADPNVKVPCGEQNQLLERPISFAIGNGNLEIVQLLLDHGAKADDYVPYALNAAQGPMVKLLWEHGVRSISELSYAISQGRSVEELQSILDRGLPADPPQDKAITPLGVAAAFGDKPAVDLLLAHGADPNKCGVFAQDTWARLIRPPPADMLLPITVASANQRDEIVQDLLEHNVRPTYETIKEAVERGTVSLSPDGTQDHYEKVISLFIGAGAFKNLSPEQSGDLLYFSLFYGGNPDPKVLKMLLDDGLSPHSKSVDTKGLSLIDYAKSVFQQRSKVPGYASIAKQILDLLETADKAESKKSETEIQSPDGDAPVLTAAKADTVTASAIQDAFARVQVLAIELPESDYQANRPKIDDALLHGYYLTLQNRANARVICRSALAVTKWGHASGLITGPTNPSLMFNLTPSLAHDNINTLLNGTVNIQSEQWIDRPGTTRLLQLKTIESHPIAVALPPQQLVALPPEGLVLPATAHRPESERKYRLFLFFSVWPQQQSPTDASATIQNVSDTNDIATAPPPASTTDGVDETYFDDALKKDRLLIADSRVHSSTLQIDAQMLRAIKSGDVATLKNVLEHAVDPNTFDPDRFGNTPLFWAVHFNQPECLKLLLDHFARDDGPTHLQSESASVLAQRAHLDLLPILRQGLEKNRATLTALLIANLHSIKINLPAFTNASLQQVTQFLLDATSQAGYLERRVTIGNMDLPPSTTFNSPAIANVSLWDAIQTIASANNLRFDVDDESVGSITLYPPKDEAIIHPPPSQAKVSPPTPANTDVGINPDTVIVPFH